MNRDELVASCGCKDVYEQQPEHEDWPAPRWMIVETHLCAEHLAKMEALAKARAA